MAKLRWEKGRLFVDFIFRGERCREFLHLPKTQDNKIAARQLVKKIEAELALGTFDYAATFPRSKKAGRFGRGGMRGFPTLGEFARNWLESLRPSLKPATFYDYGKLLSAHILPSKLSTMPINLIRPGDIRAFRAELDVKRTPNGVKKLGPRRINMVRDRLFGIFSAAEEDGLVADNPVRRVDRLQEPVPDVDPFTFDEVQRILQEAKDWERALLTVLFFTGMRPNEALGLRWDDLDFDRDQICVRWSLSRYGLGTPKTPGSIRTVDMLPPVRDALLAQRRRARLRGEFVFPNKDGGSLDLANIRDRNWRRLLRRAGLRYRPIYHCRHTYAVLELTDLENPLFVSQANGPQRSAHHLAQVCAVHEARSAHWRPVQTVYGRFVAEKSRLGRRGRLSSGG